jgi:hypothetical protein
MVPGKTCNILFFIGLNFTFIEKREKIPYNMLLLKEK